MILFCAAMKLCKNRSGIVMKVVLGERSAYSNQIKSMSLEDAIAISQFGRTFCKRM